jgi:hypothetical protein
MSLTADKFLSVKAVIFFSFWQGVVFSLLVATGIVQEVGYYTADYLSYGMQACAHRPYIVYVRGHFVLVWVYGKTQIRPTLDSVEGHYLSCGMQACAYRPYMMYVRGRALPSTESSVGPIWVLQIPKTVQTD